MTGGTLILVIIGATYVGSWIFKVIDFIERDWGGAHR